MKTDLAGLIPSFRKAARQLKRVLLPRDAAQLNRELYDALCTMPYHTAKIEKLIKKGAALDGAFEGGDTVIMRIASYYGENILELVLERKPPLDAAMLDAVDDKGWSALHHAAHWGNMKAVDWLGWKGADRNLADHEGRTPLMRAILSDRSSIQNREHCAGWLLLNDVDVMLRDHAGKSAFDYALDYSSDDLLRSIGEKVATQEAAARQRFSDSISHHLDVTPGQRITAPRLAFPARRGGA